MRLIRERHFLCFNLADDKYSLRGLGLLALVYFGALLVSAVLSPMVYAGVQAWHAAAPNAVTTYIHGKGFDDYFDRVRWLPVLIGLPWLMSVCGLWGKGNLGFRLSWSQIGDSVSWLTLGITFMAVVVLTQMAFIDVSLAAKYLDSGLEAVLIKALISALCVALLEQLIFRGLIFRLFYSAFRPWVAIWGAAAFFAYTHFKMPGAVWDQTGGAVHWYSGFYVLFWNLLAITRAFQFVPFINLLLLGVLHNLVFIRTRSLWPGVGLHAGFVFIIMSYQKLFNTLGARVMDYTAEGSVHWGFGWNLVTLVGTERIVDGFLPAILLAVYSWYYWKHSYPVPVLEDTVASTESQRN
ncbi:MAG: CPBP family intramembrane glutamic endopeptidase [Verrucomicrobiota bacterium]|nr:CPBP family intramembrane glutamic endopeptidase [Verrucomicrobiota bacterium]